MQVDGKGNLQILPVLEFHEVDASDVGEILRFGTVADKSRLSGWVGPV